VVNDPPVWGDFLSILRFLDVLTPAKRNAEHQALPVNAHVFPLALAPERTENLNPDIVVMKSAKDRV